MKLFITFLFTMTFWMSAHAASLNDLSWLAGNWSDNTLEVHFTTPDGNQILGLSKMVVSGKVAFYEFIEIDLENNDLVLKPKPFGNTGVFFKATVVESNKVVFENPEHDFPKKITYSLTDKNELRLIAEGFQDGKNVAQEFLMHKK